MAYPPFHPSLRRASPESMSEEQFHAAFPAEDEHIEFKAGFGAKVVQRTAVAFSNSAGGVILIGVDDDGNVVGRSLTPGLETDITQAIMAVHSPGRYWLHELNVAGRPVAVIAVARRSQGFSQTPDGLVLVRRSAHSVPLMGVELLQFMTERVLVRFDATDSGISLSRADSARVEEIRKAFGWGRSSKLEERLKNERLVAADGRSTLTVAGALTLLDEPATELGKAYVEVLRYPDDGIDYDRREEFSGPVQAQVADATRFVMDELGTDLIVAGIRRRELPKLPEVVVREAIANAVAHRSYEEVGRAIHVELRPDRVIVESPGGLPEPVTEANIRETQSARNIDVLRVLRRLHLAEDRGRGVDVIQDSMAAALLDPPIFQDLEHSVRVTLPIRGAITPQERAWVDEVESQGLIAPRDRLLLVHAARGESLTNERARELLSVDSRDARKALRRLRDAGFLEQIGARGGAHYILSPSVGAPAAFRLNPSALRELVMSLASGGVPITNALVREATGLDRAETLRLLERLVKEGRLVRRGERRGTHYVIR